MSTSGDPISLDAMPDEALMQRIADEDRDAMAVLVRRHQQHVLALAFRFAGRWHTAEDIGQEVFIRVFRAAKTYRPDAQFTTWLYRLVANLCWDRRRKIARELRLQPEPPPHDVDPPSAGLERQDRIERVQRAILELPDRQRLAIILHRYQSLSHREIAEATGWSQSAVESCLVRAYKALRDALSDLNST